jgi:hypothetical protein
MKGKKTMRGSSRKRKSDGTTNRRATPIRLPVRQNVDSDLNAREGEDSEDEETGGGKRLPREKDASGSSDDDSENEDDDDESTGGKEALIEKQRREIDHLQRLVGHVSQEKSKLEEEVERVKRENDEVVGSGKKSKRSINNSNVWTRQEKVWIQELGGAVRNDVGRRLKFLPPGYKKWSEDPKTVCGRVMTHFSSVGDVEERKRVWNEVLRHHLSKKLGEYKNKATQGMREQLKGK